MNVSALYHLETEAQFMAQVVRLAKLFGWRCYHTRRSKGSEAGFPDLVLVRRPRVLFVELKAERGSMTPQQHEWLQALGECGLEVYVWKPSSWPNIEKMLR